MKYVILFFAVVALIGTIVIACNSGFLEPVQSEIMIIGLIVFSAWKIAHSRKEKDA